MEKERKKRKPFEKLSQFTDAQRSLMAEYYQWAKQYADTEIKRRSEKKDKIPAWVIEDAAVNALIYAAVRWDSTVGVSFKTYYHRGFYTAVWNSVKEYCQNRDAFVSENVTVVGGEKRYGSDTIYLKDTEPFSQESFEDALCDKIDVEKLLSKLTPLQSESVCRFYLCGERQSDIARDMGVSRQNINQALRNGTAAMREIYTGQCDQVRRGRRKRVSL